MPHSFGLRARTRHLFSRNFKEHGPIHLETYLTPYKVGDIVDIKANPGEQRGMPHKFYHGRTGIVFNVAPRAVGVIVYKIVRSRYIEKRVNIRIEHVKHSKCREEFLRRVKSNRQALSEAKQKGERVNLKRQPKQPREGQMLKSKTTPETIAPIAYDTYI
ncbi:hypothetical protein E3P99_01445 [Wallemia hederae]|uniref:60S ribosomal protein L21-A n=1 Tax=Wallemia hederae TaxID=1540922 RepID=A0A4T0FUR1_9BASI|nr:hypothetical protein E3P99_01445 [Wallemia hederae]